VPRTREEDDRKMQTRGFKVSLFELIGAVTGFGVALGLVLARSDVLSSVFASCVVVFAAITTGVAFSHPSRHLPLFSFIAGFAVTYLITGGRTFPESVYFLQRTFGSTWEHMASLVQLEISVTAGVISAWITRSLRD
jgi:hypothetical protein